MSAKGAEVRASGVGCKTLALKEEVLRGAKL